MNAISVLGDGSFGTAMAYHLANNGYPVTLWCYNKTIADSINKHHHNHRYWPDRLLPDTIVATTDLAKAASASIILQAIPVKYLRSVIKDAITATNEQTIWVTLSKGIEEQTLFVPSMVIASLLKQSGINAPIVALSGPNFAQDLMDKRPMIATISTTEEKALQKVLPLISNSSFTCQFHHDMLGIELLGALKNVYALAIACAHTLWGDSTRAMILMQALEEQKRLLQAASGNSDTLYTAAGVGDLVLTSYSALSRNSKTGQMLAHHQNLDQIVAQLGTLPEGVNTLASIERLEKKYQVDLPLARATYKLVLQQAEPSVLLIF